MDGWSLGRVSLGIPTPVRGGMPIAEPVNLGTGWVGFDYDAAFGVPTKIVNDAVMQAIGSYEGGRMLFLSLGTGLGSALIVDGIVEPLELGHLPFGRRPSRITSARGTGESAARSAGARRSSTSSTGSRAAMQPDYVVIGGGGVDQLDRAAAERPPRRQRVRVHGRFPALGPRLDPERRGRLRNRRVITDRSKPDRPRTRRGPAFAGPRAKIHRAGCAFVHSSG